MHSINHLAAKGEGPTVATVAPQQHSKDHDRNSEALSHAAQAALVIEGEEYARTYLDRLAQQQAQPEELAALLTFLRGEMLHGACRVIEKALEGVSHG